MVTFLRAVTLPVVVTFDREVRECQKVSESAEGDEIWLSQQAREQKIEKVSLMSVMLSVRDPEQ